MTPISALRSFAGNQTWGQLDYRAILAAKASPAVIARGNLAMLRFDAQSILPNVDIPTLVVGGKHDRVTKPSASDRIDELLPQAVKMLVPAGHMGFWEQHAEVSKLISEFAAKVTHTPLPVVTSQRAATLLS